MDGQKGTQGDYPVMSTFSVVIFACESHNIAARNWESFRPLLSKLPHQRILALDGQISPQIINLIEPCILVQNHHRRGYVAWIRNALALINSEFFLWLEEDWRAIQQLDVAAASRCSALIRHGFRCVGAKSRNSAQRTLSSFLEWSRLLVFQPIRRCADRSGKGSFRSD